jgi:hypothetical protein
VGARGSLAECGRIAAKIRRRVRCLRNHSGIRMRGAVSLRRPGVRSRLGHTEAAPPLWRRGSVSSAACLSAAAAMLRRCLAVRARNVTAWSCRQTFARGRRDKVPRAVRRGRRFRDQGIYRTRTRIGIAGTAFSASPRPSNPLSDCANLSGAKVEPKQSLISVAALPLSPAKRQATNDSEDHFTAG